MKIYISQQLYQYIKENSESPELDCQFYFNEYMESNCFIWNHDEIEKHYITYTIDNNDLIYHFINEKPNCYFLANEE